MSGIKRHTVELGRARVEAIACEGDGYLATLRIGGRVVTLPVSQAMLPAVQSIFGGHARLCLMVDEGDPGEVDNWHEQIASGWGRPQPVEQRQRKTREQARSVGPIVNETPKVTPKARCKPGPKPSTPATPGRVESDRKLLALALDKVGGVKKHLGPAIGCCGGTYSNLRRGLRDGRPLPADKRGLLRQLAKSD